MSRLPPRHACQKKPRHRIAGASSRPTYHLVMKTLSEMRELLGKDIQVTLNKQEVVRGKLIGFGNGGDFEILQADGMIHYCWPMLDVTEL